MIPPEATAAAPNVAVAPVAAADWAAANTLPAATLPIWKRNGKSNMIY